MSASFADDPTGSPSSEHKGALCAPADPSFDAKAFNDLMQTTKTDVSEWISGLCRTYFDSREGPWISPLAYVGLGGLHQVIERFGVEARVGGRRARLCVQAKGSRSDRRRNLQACPSRRRPYCSSRAPPRDCRRRICVCQRGRRFHAPRRIPTDNELSKAGAVLALCRFAHLLAKGLESRIVDRLRRRNRDHLVGAGFGGRRLRLASRLVLRGRRSCAGDEHRHEKTQTYAAHCIAPRRCGRRVARRRLYRRDI